MIVKDTLPELNSSSNNTLKIQITQHASHIKGTSKKVSFEQCGLNADRSMQSQLTYT